MPTALITGATSGIGLATAEVFASQNIDLVIAGRRQERLDALKARLSASVRVHTLRFDVRDADAVFAAVESLPDDFKQIDILVNNAGNAHGLANFQNGALDDFDAMIDGNVKGLIYVTKAVLPGMLARKSGHIVNVGSIAGKEVYPRGNVYCASKHAVDALNQALRIDLMGQGIRVGAVNPGMVETEFSEVRFKGDTDKAAKVYEGFRPLKAEDVAKIVAFMVTRPAHVNIADLLVMPADQPTATLVDRKR